MIAWLDDAQKTAPFVWHNFEFSDHRDLAKSYQVLKPQTYLLLEDDEIIETYQGGLNIAIFNEWIGKESTVAEIIESSEHFIKEDDVIIEATPAIIEDLEIAAPEETKLTPPVDIVDVVDEDAVYDDEFSDEDLGNDIPQTIDPDDLF